MKEVRRFNPARALVLGFLMLIAIGTALLMLPVATVGERLGFVDALFTATSAVCVTGLVVVDTGTAFTTMGQLTLMTLIQIGGLGFMTMAVLIFIALGRRIGLGSRIMIQESLNHLSLSGVVRLVRAVLVYTFIVQGVATVILGVRFAAEMGWAKGFYYGLFHSISAFCNAGFDLMGNFTSLTVYQGDWLVNLTIMALFVSSGLGFFVVLDVFRCRRNLSNLSFHSKLVLSITAVLLIVGFGTIFLLEYSNPATLAPLGVGEKILSTAFTAATPRTAGFNVLPTDQLHQSSQFFIILLMFIGASPASTGGGIKTATFGVVMVAVYSMIRGESDAVLFKKRLPQEIIHKALAIIFLGFALVVAVTLLLSITEDAPLITIMFETVSAFGTVGLSAGITGELSVVGRLLIILTMFVGRVGPVTLTLAFARRLSERKVRHPEDRVMVG